MSSTILLSIKPEFIEKIFSGKKRFEYRKSIFKHRIDKVIMYSTMPVKMIVGEFTVRNILRLDIDVLWENTRDYSGISKEFYDKYFQGHDFGTALSIGEVIEYPRPLTIFEKFGYDFRPPQSYKYIEK